MDQDRYSIGVAMNHRVFVFDAWLLLMATCLQACGASLSVSPIPQASRTSGQVSAPIITPSREPTSTTLVESTSTPDLSTPTLSLDDLATVVAAETVPPTQVVSMEQQDEAHRVLGEYLGALANGDYERGDALYGGSFEPLWALTIFRLDPSDRLAIWRSICGGGFLQCLPVRDIALQEATSTAFHYKVSFSNRDGSLFVVGPCCGGNATEHPPVSLFEYEVIQSGDNMLVVGLPPYVP